VTRRTKVLPERGTALISTDLHGNLEDFVKLRGVAEAAWARGEPLHWVLLGDVVHGPDARARANAPQVHDFADESPRLVEALLELKARRPDHVHLVLGNHDAGHLGFAHTAKFHDDEVVALEARLTPAEVERMKALFSMALLVVVAPCGLLLSHGAPGDALTSLAELDGPLPPVEPARSKAIHELLWSYGQPGPVAAGALERISRETGLGLHVVVHGHDRDLSGWFIEGDNQVQPVIFCALKENKRYLLVDLAKPIRSPKDLEAGPLRRLYDEAG
jgi:hypothetical protein